MASDSKTLNAEVSLPQEISPPVAALKELDEHPAKVDDGLIVELCQGVENDRQEGTQSVSGSEGQARRDSTNEGESQAVDQGPPPPCTCPECAELFATRSELTRHQRALRHAVLPCVGCRKVFLSQKALSTHSRMTQHINEPIPENGDPTTCLAGERPPEAPPTERKELTHYTYACPGCSKAFTLTSDLTSHQKRERHAIWPCGGCKKVFLSEAALGNHMKMTAHITARRTESIDSLDDDVIPALSACNLGEGNAVATCSFACPECHQTFPNSSDLTAHQKKSRHAVHACTGCNRTFLSPLALGNHIRMTGHGNGEAGTEKMVVGEEIRIERAKSEAYRGPSGANNDQALWDSNDSWRKSSMSEREPSKSVDNNGVSPVLVLLPAKLPRRPSWGKPPVSAGFDSRERATTCPTNATSGNKKKSEPAKGRARWGSYESAYSAKSTRSRQETLESISESGAKNKTQKKKKAANKAVFDCRVCGKLFFTEESLRDHSGSGDLKVTYFCDCCGEVFCNRMDLSSHRWDYQHGFPEDMVSCPACFCTFSSPEALSEHWDGESKPPAGRTLPCTYCSMKFCSEKALLQHVTGWGHCGGYDFTAPWESLPNPYCMRGNFQFLIRDKTTELMVVNPFWTKEGDSAYGKEQEIYVTVTNEVQTIQNWLALHIFSKPTPLAVGFDLEWKPIWEMHSPDANKVALVQMCVHQHCLIIQMCQLAELPGEFLFFLASTAYIKAGVGIKQDLERMERYYNIICHGFYDVGGVAQLYLGNVKQEGLTSLSELLFNIKLDKPKEITISNWEQIHLTEAQIRYAAIDALTGWAIFHKLSQLPTLEPSKLESKMIMQCTKKAKKDVKVGDVVCNLEKNVLTEKFVELYYETVHRRFKQKHHVSFGVERLQIECILRGFPLPHLESFAFENEEPACVHSVVMIKGQVIGASFSGDLSDSLESAAEYALNYIMSM